LTVENWLFERYGMRNIIFFFKISHVIFAKCYYCPFGQYLKSGWVNRLSRPLNRFLPGGNRLNRYKNRLNRFWPPRRQSARSLRWQLRSLRCQFLQSVLSDCQDFRAVSTVFCALLLRSLTRNRLNRFWNRLNRFSVFLAVDFFPFYILSLSFFPSQSFFTAAAALFLLSHFHTPLQNLSCSLSFGRVVGSVLPDVFPPSSSISLGVFDPIFGSRYCSMLFFLVLDPMRSCLSIVSFVGYILV
jgi:hypothetical protein